jgi:hypothetical protein
MNPVKSSTYIVVAASCNEPPAGQVRDATSSAASAAITCAARIACGGTDGAHRDQPPRSGRPARPAMPNQVELFEPRQTGDRQQIGQLLAVRQARCYVAVPRGSETGGSLHGGWQELMRGS